jgi:hypothetical protein
MSENVENYAGQEDEATRGCKTSLTEAEPVRRMSFEEQGGYLRELIKDTGVKVKATIGYANNCVLPGDIDRGEMIANLTLAYRKLEDARMRVGKAMQAYQGGVSILDKIRDERTGAKEAPCDGCGSDTEADDPNCAG